MTEEYEQNDYETFPYDSFVEYSINIDYEDEYDELLHEKNNTGIEIEITEIIETEIETETGKTKPYHSDIWKYFEKKRIV